jgi:REP element-mobilizing transposase RayT
MNRGVAQRQIFETPREIRFFQSRIARMVRARKIELHAYSILFNHFHLLVRSVTGELASVMRFVQDRYAQRFNWQRDRRGPVMQGRYRSPLIENPIHWENVVRYIDRNAVDAGVVDEPAQYEFGSARYHATRTWPPWLSRDPVAGAVKRAARTQDYAPRDYLRVFGDRMSASETRLVELSPTRGRHPSAPLESLINAAPAAVQRWFDERSRASDGHSPAVAILDPRSLPAIPDVSELDERGRRMLEVGLLRTVCSLSMEEIGHQLKVSAATVARDARGHARRMLTDEEYSDLWARLVHDALRREFREPVARVIFAVPE